MFHLIFIKPYEAQTQYEKAYTKNSKKVSKKKAISIFKSISLIDPINCLVTTLENQGSIICIANKSGIEGDDIKFYSNANIFVYLMRKKANTWRIELEKPIFSENFTYCEFYKTFELAMIENKPHVYFLYKVSPQGNAVNMLQLKFSLLSLTDFQLHSLDFTGEPIHIKEENLEKVKGDFTNFDNLHSKYDLINFLEDKANKSELIYSGKSKEVNANKISYYEKQWQKDNPSIKSMMEIRDIIYEGSLKITYYDKSIFPNEPGYIFDSIENDKFKFVSVFRNNILGYNKTKKKYFPVLVESCSHGCHKEIAFLNEDTLRISYIEANNQNVIVNLNKMTFKINTK